MNRQVSLQNNPTQSRIEQRRFLRHDFRLEAQVLAAQSSVCLKGTVTDLSIGGCYVEMLSPLPVDTQAELVFSIGNSTLHIRGEVRTSQPGFGMGVAFTDMGTTGRDNVHKLISATERGAETGEVTPFGSPTETQSGVPTTSKAFEGLVRLLLRKGLVTKEELAEEFEKSKR